MSYTDQDDPRNYDLNGNFYCPEDPKSSVLQILTETLRQSPPSVTTTVGLSSTSHATHSPDNNNIKDYTSVDILNDNDNANSEDSGSNISFNPGDKLSSPVPPLAPQNLFENEFRSATGITTNPVEQNEPKVSQSYNATTPKFSLRSQFKQCHLATVLGSARRCFKQLSAVKDGLAILVSQDEQLSQGKKATSTGPDYALIATLGEYIVFLTRQAFTPAHRLYTASLGLHLSEDLIRNPTDPALLNFKQGYIIRPNWNSIIHTQMKLRFCVDSATEIYHRFGQNETTSSSSQNSPHHQMQLILVTLMHAFQDLYATALGSTDIFKVLLHIEDYGEKILQEFLLSLESLERSDLLLQVQALRRSFDDIVIMLEQLSWAAYIVFRLASGKSLTPSPDGSTLKIPTTTTTVVGVDTKNSSTKSSNSQNSVKNDSNGRSKSSSVTRSSSRPHTESRDNEKLREKSLSSYSKSLSPSQSSSHKLKYGDSQDYSHQSRSQSSRHKSGSSGKGTSESSSASTSRHSHKDRSKTNPVANYGEEKSKRSSSSSEKGKYPKSHIPTLTTHQRTDTSRSRKPQSSSSTRPHTPDRVSSSSGGSYSRHHLQSNSSLAGKDRTHNSYSSHHSSREDRKASTTSSDPKSGGSRKSKSKSHSTSRDESGSRILNKVNIETGHHHRSSSSPSSSRIPSASGGSSSVRTKDKREREKERERSSSHRRTRTHERDDEDDNVIKFGNKF